MQFLFYFLAKRSLNLLVSHRCGPVSYSNHVGFVVD
jgi:hypothetical protein